MTIIESNSTHETSVYFQSVYYNDNVSSNQRHVHVNSQQVEQNGEQGRKVREGDREQWVSGEGEGALVRNGSGVGWKWPLVKLNT